MTARTDETVRGTETPLALLGSVKGVCDFLREFAGVRESGPATHAPWYITDRAANSRLVAGRGHLSGW